MEIDRYRDMIQSILTQQANDDHADPAVETQIAFDCDRDRYFLFHVGWRGERRVHGCVLHLEIKGGKIWIQRDGLEEGIANLLIAAGVPTDAIVLGYRSPYMRQFMASSTAG